MSVVTSNSISQYADAHRALQLLIAMVNIGFHNKVIASAAGRSSKSHTFGRGRLVLIVSVFDGSLHFSSQLPPQVLQIMCNYMGMVIVLLR